MSEAMSIYRATIWRQGTRFRKTKIFGDQSDAYRFVAYYQKRGCEGEVQSAFIAEFKSKYDLEQEAIRKAQKAELTYDHNPYSDPNYLNSVNKWTPRR